MNCCSFGCCWLLLLLLLLQPTLTKSSVNDATHGLQTNDRAVSNYIIMAPSGIGFPDDATTRTGVISSVNAVINDALSIYLFSIPSAHLSAHATLTM